MKWIPAIERLPERRKEVFCKDEKGIKYVCFYVDDFTEEIEFEDNDFTPSYVHSDENKGKLTLKAGWYEECENAGYYDYVTHPRNIVEWYDETHIPEKGSEEHRLKKLLREVCVRANIIFPEQENEIEMFDEKFKNKDELMINLHATLGLGEIDEESIKQNKEHLNKLKHQQDEQPTAYKNPLAEMREEIDAAGFTEKDFEQAEQSELSDDEIEKMAEKEFDQSKRLGAQSPFVDGYLAGYKAALQTSASAMDQYASERTAPLLEALKWIRKEGYKKGSGVIHKYVSDALKNYNHE